MKKLTLVVALTLAATSAFASKARMTALQNAEHVLDTRDVFNRPDQAMLMSEHAILELADYAAGANDATPNAEGGFLRKMGETSVLGFYLGNKDNLSSQSLGLVSATPKTKNPLNVYYASKMGDMNWGVGLNYSNHENKAAATSKSSNMGLNAGVSTSTWEAQLGLGLTGEATSAGATKYEQKSPMSLRGAYTMDTMYFYGTYKMWGAKTKDIASSTTTTDVDQNQVTLGVTNTHKKDGADFFYGAAYTMLTNKVKDGQKTETTALPVYMGVEADAASWLVLRGSISQNVLLGTTKTTPATGSATEVTLDDNTKVAAGLGLKLGKFLVDGSLAATSGANGKLGSDANFVSNVGMTYNF